MWGQPLAMTTKRGLHSPHALPKMGGDPGIPCSQGQGTCSNAPATPGSCFRGWQESPRCWWGTHTHPVVVRHLVPTRVGVGQDHVGSQAFSHHSVQWGPPPSPHIHRVHVGSGDTAPIFLTARQCQRRPRGDPGLPPSDELGPPRSRGVVSVKATKTQDLNKTHNLITHYPKCSVFIENPSSYQEPLGSELE